MKNIRVAVDCALFGVKGEEEVLVCQQIWGASYVWEEGRKEIDRT